MSNLLPGTTYSLRVRGIDQARRTKGPWAGNVVEAGTGGSGRLYSVFESRKTLWIGCHENPTDFMFIKQTNNCTSHNLAENVVYLMR